MYVYLYVYLILRTIVSRAFSHFFFVYIIALLYNLFSNSAPQGCKCAQ